MSGKEPSQLSGEKISFNSRAVLLGLFALVGFILLVFTISVNVFSPEQSGRLNTVFIAAISGSLALGGTLISQLWGKSTGRPTVYSTIPANTATGVALDNPVSASFNMLMDESSINSKTFTLKDKDNANVSGTITLEGGNAIFRPSNPLKAGTKHTATITKEAKSTTGSFLESDKEWSFTTAGVAKLPDILSRADDQNVEAKPNSPVKIVLKANHPDKRKLSFIKVTDPSKGKLSEIDTSGNVTYTPNKDSIGIDSFTFKANDGKVDSNIATVSITIS
jgi:hypothetical protein